jgi:hypothetical protein
VIDIIAAAILHCESKAVPFTVFFRERRERKRSFLSDFSFLFFNLGPVVLPPPAGERGVASSRCLPDELSIGEAIELNDVFIAGLERIRDRNQVRLIEHNNG